MKRLYLIGGFGNILFQLLAFYSLQKNKKIKIKLVDVLTQKNIFTKIMGWKIHKPIYNHIIKKDNFNNPNLLMITFDFFCFYISKLIKKPFLNREFVLEYSVFPNYDNISIIGYFQNLSNFSQNEIHLFCNYVSKRLNIGQIVDRTVIHFRWGDSVWAKKNEEYYKTVRQIIKSKKENYYLITDDKKKSKEFFKDTKLKITIVSNSEIEDFIFLARSKNIYCAPSTFSWWASMICNSEKNITMPIFFKEYFNNDSGVKYL